MYIIFNKCIISILLNRNCICIYDLLLLFCLFVIVKGVGFSIYKSYYISAQKTKYINVYRIFVNEYTKRIKGNKTLQM